MLDAHVSQFYEWLPYNAWHFGEIPVGTESRKGWLSDQMAALAEQLADRFRDRLIATYGPQRGVAIRLVEAFEGSEYGAPLDAAARARLFPFLAQAGSGSGTGPQ